MGTQEPDKDFINSTIEEIAKKKIQTEIVPPYNVFSMWNMSENDHSKILLALMRYKTTESSYPLIYSFLERFAKGCIGTDNFCNTKIEFNASFNVNKSLIDGLITFEHEGTTKAVIIENKIYDACDQPDQIHRYIGAIINEGIKKDNIWVFYITGDGSKVVDENSYANDPEDTDSYIGNRFVELNYKYDITAWLKEKVLDARIYPEALTSVVRAYVEYLEKDLFYEDSFIPDNIDDLKNSFYSLYDSYLELRGERSEWKNKYDNLSGEEKDNYEITENKYNVAKNLVRAIEKDAFGAFKKYSEEILNDSYKIDSRDDLKWIVKHRNIIGKDGFIQIRLDNGWQGAHLEWIPIDADKMFTETVYKLELHVEGNVELAEEWRNNLQNNTDLRKNKKNKVVLRYKVQADKPIAKMDYNELKGFLESIYCEKLQKCCIMLINMYKDV